MPGTSINETLLVIKFGPPSSDKVSAFAERLLVLIGSLKMASMLDTSVFRGFGETGAIELTVNGSRIWTACWAEAGVGWMLPARSVAML